MGFAFLMSEVICQRILILDGDPLANGPSSFINYSGSYILDEPEGSAIHTTVRCLRDRNHIYIYIYIHVYIYIYPYISYIPYASLELCLFKERCVQRAGNLEVHFQTELSLPVTRGLVYPSGNRNVGQHPGTLTPSALNPETLNP